MGTAATVETPVLDEFGILRLGAAWVPLSPTQELVIGPLLDNFDRPVSRSSLDAAVWPDGAPARGLDIHVLRLRSRLAALGLTILTIRGRGFVLTTESAAS